MVRPFWYALVTWDLRFVRCLTCGTRATQECLQEQHDIR